MKVRGSVRGDKRANNLRLQTIGLALEGNLHRSRSLTSYFCIKMNV